MNNNLDKWINKPDKAGDEWIKNYLIPIAKGTVDFVVKDSKMAQGFLSLKTAFMEEKIAIFLNYVEDNEEVEILDFIDSLNNVEKKFFIESINKVVDLDDNLQIYILAHLTKAYKNNNNSLDYYEKQLFYNISTFSEDDFKIFYCIYLNEIKENKKYFYLTSYIKKEIISISLNKFSHLGLIHISTSLRQNQQDDITSHESYKLGEYSETLFLCLKGYFIDVSCDEIIEKVQYAKITGGFR